MTPPSERLLRAIAAHAGALSGIRVQSEEWASATFVGMRHRLWFDAVPSVELDSFLRGIGEIDLPMPGHFVADIELIERHDHGDMARIGIAALTIEAR